MASTSASTITMRKLNAVHRRQALICTSDLNASQTVHGAATSSSNSQAGLVNWKFIPAPM